VDEKTGCLNVDYHIITLRPSFRVYENEAQVAMGKCKTKINTVGEECSMHAADEKCVQIFA
jgi:hypothetical protein